MLDLSLFHLQNIKKANYMDTIYLKRKIDVNGKLKVIKKAR